MLIVKLDQENAIALLELTGALDEKDFLAAASEIDPLIRATGQLNGLIIHTRSFPSWDSFAAFISHLKFVQNYHQKIKRLALVTDSLMGSVFEALVSHFIEAELKHFPHDEMDHDEMDPARQWVLE